MANEIRMQAPDGYVLLLTVVFNPETNQAVPGMFVEPDVFDTRGYGIIVANLIRAVAAYIGVSEDTLKNEVLHELNQKMK